MNPTTNQICVIVPYWLDAAQTWVFDDPEVGLFQEPFVSGIPEMIDELVSDIPAARKGFRLLFAASPFPGYQRRIDWLRTEYGGQWYRDATTGLEGWLCPALDRYFRQPPAHLYIKAESLSATHPVGRNTGD